MRIAKEFPIEDLHFLKNQLLDWSQQYEHVVWLDSNLYPQRHSNAEIILAVDAIDIMKTNHHNAFDQLEHFQKKQNDWLFGYLGYDLKNDTESLTSENQDGLDFSDLYFFRPRKVITLSKKAITFHYLNENNNEIESDFNTIKLSNSSSPEKSTKPLKIQSRLTKSEYLQRGQQFLDHIHKGDIYEANFCQEFYAKDASIVPLSIYKALNNISKPPFAAYLKLENLFACCASPERYLKKEENVLISQPIKGTAKRHQHSCKDSDAASNLLLSEKERAENVMIVDLVRNDLSKTATKGSVKVTELYQLYTFKQVHQLISTITSELKESISPVAAIKSTFPMGSMTGAPKISAMEIIEENEASKRGLYSGAIGYFTPEGDFDFNVVIRSILYNATKKFVSFSVGSAITSQSDLNAEYEECLVKAAAMRKVLSSW